MKLIDEHTEEASQEVVEVMTTVAGGLLEELHALLGAALRRLGFGAEARGDYTLRTRRRRGRRSLEASP